MAVREEGGGRYGRRVRDGREGGLGEGGLTGVLRQSGKPFRSLSRKSSHREWLVHVARLHLAICTLSSCLLSGSL